MAHFAKLDENNYVIDVCVVNNDDVQNLPFPESEPVGIAFLTEWSGGYSNWKQTSYNNNFRVSYASIGGYYDPVNDKFVPMKPFASWVLDEQLNIWVAPVPIPNPDESYKYVWDEATLSWIDESVQ